MVYLPFIAKFDMRLSRYILTFTAIAGCICLYVEPGYFHETVIFLIIINWNNKFGHFPSPPNKPKVKYIINDFFRVLVKDLNL
jgi:hypothetical protein